MLSIQNRRKQINEERNDASKGVHIKHNLVSLYMHRQFVTSSCSPLSLKLKTRHIHSICKLMFNVETDTYLHA